jgi:hypothetical protein
MSQSLIPMSQSSSSSVVTRGSTRRLERSVGNSLSLMSARHVLDVARVRAEEDLQVERIHAVESITSEGVMSAAQIMNRARILMDMNPMDAGIIQSVAQLGCLGLADIVSGSAGKLR